MQLRPKTFREVIGQKTVKEYLRIAIGSALKRSEALGHVLFMGPPGVGKTTFATAIANEMKKEIVLLNGGNIKTINDILPFLPKSRWKRECESSRLIFVDEVHRISSAVQESLFTIMEDFRLDSSDVELSTKLEPFTLIGATTEAGMLLRPFYDRFLHQLTLGYYTNEELAEIVRYNARRMDVDITNIAVNNIVNCSRSVPRLANNILFFCRDIATVNKTPNRARPYISDNLVAQALRLKKIDEKGLDENDRMYIMALERVRKPLGLQTLVGMTGLSKETIENQIEPYLLKLGIIEKAQKGRKLL